jgi:hypothetical protein
VFHVQSDDAEAEMQGRGSDDEIGEINADPPAHLFTVDAPSQPRDLLRKRMLCFARIKSALKMNNIQRADVTLLHDLWMAKLHFARHRTACHGQRLFCQGSAILRACSVTLHL